VNLKSLIFAGAVTLLFIFIQVQSFAQFDPVIEIPEVKIEADGNQATPSAEKQKELEKIKEEDITKPEEEKEKKEFLALFSKRQINEPGITNFMGYAVQYAVKNGVPANTIILILLLPFLATMVVIVRNILGFPTLEMLVPIALAITLIATGPIAGLILLATILFASTISRYILKRIRIMQLPKMAISMMIVSIFVFASLAISASFGLASVTQLSFFPVLLLILLSDKIVALQLSRGTKPAIVITFFTLVLGIAGYAVLSVGIIRSYVLLYPEIILALIPLNILLGRYFGLRLTEYHRFAQFRRYVNQ
jgi:membrane-associated HD superfamily phosphohydrolase